MNDFEERVFKTRLITWMCAISLIWLAIMISGVLNPYIVGIGEQYMINGIAITTAFILLQISPILIDGRKEFKSWISDIFNEWIYLLRGKELKENGITRDN